MPLWNEMLSVDLEPSCSSVRVNVGHNPVGRSDLNTDVGDVYFSIGPSLSTGYGEGWLVVMSPDGVETGKIKLSYSYDRSLVSQIRLGLIPESKKLISEPSSFFTFHAMAPLPEFSVSLETASNRRPSAWRKSENCSQEISSTSGREGCNPLGYSHSSPQESQPSSSPSARGVPFARREAHCDTALEHSSSSCCPSSSAVETAQENTHAINSCSTGAIKANFRDSFTKDIGSLQLNTEIPRIESPGLDSSAFDAISR
jgi:hypothetical protein